MKQLRTQEMVGGWRMLVNSLDYLDIYDARLSAKSITTSYIAIDKLRYPYAQPLPESLKLGLLTNSSYPSRLQFSYPGSGC